jgi:dephospho-CoA kinase
LKTIGLTGGIGSGKTTAAEMLAELGAAVIHADQVGHEVYRPGSTGWQAVVEAFGDGVLDPSGAVDRKKLAAIVFSDPAELRRLNAIVHPLIAAAVRERIAKLRGDGFRAPIVVEAAILIEANWLSLVDEVWLLVAPPDAVAARVQAQRGMAASELRARIEAQMSDAERRRHATVIIENNGSLVDLRRRIEAAWARCTSA